MAALYNFEDQYGQNSRTLGDWVKNFRLKKIQMKRKLRKSSGELRVCAILSTALKTAELELRQKQQERFQKWLKFQAKIEDNELQTRSETPSHYNNNNQQQDNEIKLLARHDECDANTRRKQSEEIDNLWKCELSELDNFMRSLNSSSNQSRNSLNAANIIGCRRESLCQSLTSQQQSIQVTS